MMVMPVLIENGDVILFQGDSITDCGRDINDGYVLGRGYAMMASSWFSALYPEKKVTFLNRGISGNRIQDLEARWQNDCIALAPDWVSILIGINDCAGSGADVSAQDFAKGFACDYRVILSRTKENFPDVKIILCEPFLLPCPADIQRWRENLNHAIQAVRDIAREYKTLYIPLDGIFAKASTLTESEYWSSDGVHPTLAGHALIAQNWLEAVGVS
jgi:acyl-CoA thioesterase-1